MIGFITGTVIYSDYSSCILETSNGLGYEVFCNFSPTNGDTIKLFISHIFKEFGQELFGHKTIDEKKLFELLISVKGVGPKSAFSLLKNLNVEGVLAAIINEDKNLLKKAPGIGPKASSQIILDLKEKLLKEKNDLFPQLGSQGSEGSSDLNGAQGISDLLKDAITACRELGFNEKDFLKKAQTIMNSQKVRGSGHLVELVMKEL